MYVEKNILRLHPYVCKVKRLNVKFQLCVCVCVCYNSCNVQRRRRKKSTLPLCGSPFVQFAKVIKTNFKLFRHFSFSLNFRLYTVKSRIQLSNLRIIGVQ